MRSPRDRPVTFEGDRIDFVVRISADGASSRHAGGIAAIFIKNGATQMSFKVGDTVRLKSGSPLMTVTDVRPDDTSEPNVACVWFSDDEAPHKGEFPEAALEMEEIETEEEDEEEEEEGDEEEGDEEDDDDEEEEDEEAEEGKKGKGKKDK
jgi:uncharacterized protein YodC (DUF2158 family)